MGGKGMLRCLTVVLCLAVVAAGCGDEDSSDSPQADLAVSDDACATTPLRGYGFDRYGGWKGIRRPATGRFTVAEVDGRWWFFTPEGNAFFASGPSGIDPFGDAIGATGRAPYYENVLAKHGGEEAWADATVERMCRLGFRVRGGWLAESAIDLMAERIPYTVNIEVYGVYPEGPASVPSLVKPRRDVFVADAAERAAAYVAGHSAVQRCARDPWCVGVYVENEVPYAPGLTAGGSHLDVYLAQAPGSAGKRGVQAFFATRYGGDLGAFNEVWGTALVTWDDIQSVSRLGTCPTGVGIVDDLCAMRGPRDRLLDRMAFEAEVAGRAARHADDALAAVEPAMLNLGPRLVVSPFFPDLLQAIAASVDVMSLNNYDTRSTANVLLSAADRDLVAALGGLGFDPFERLEQVAAVTGKPVLVTEWFYRVRRPGITSLPPFLPEVGDAGAQAAAAERYLKGLHAIPAVIGEHWFQWQDQPIEGRFDGENQLIGIVDIDDDENQPLADTIAGVNALRIDRRLGLASSD